MSGIAYNLNKIRGVVFDIDGVLSPSVIPIDEEGQPMRMMNVKDGYAMAMAIKNNLKICIISGGSPHRVRKRFESLGVRDIYCNVANKLPVLNKWMHECSLTKEEVAYMGDDIPDIPCMKEVGLPCAPVDAAPETKETAIYISRFNGGYCCARDLLQQILSARGQWLSDEKNFEW